MASSTSICDSEELLLKRNVTFSDLRDEIRENGDTLHLAGMQWVSFRILIRNNAGTLEHYFPASPNYIGVNGASSTPSTLPTGTNSSTPFTAGAIRYDTLNHVIILDTNYTGFTDDLSVMTSVYSVSTGTNIVVAPGILSSDVNGVTRNRLTLSFYQTPDRTLFDINTTNIEPDENVNIGVQGFIPVYA